MPAKTILLQVEAVRSGTAAYKPHSSKLFTDLTASYTQDAYPNISDHATAVAGYWQANGAADLVTTWYVIEQGNFEVNYLKAGKTLPSLACPAHLVIEPCGSSWEGVSPGAIQKLQPFLESNNALGIVSPPDAGQGFYMSPCQATGPNILRVASSVTGSDMENQPAVEIFFPVSWNSYVQPAICAGSGIIPMIDWLLQNNISYAASDLKQIIIETAQADSQGRKIFNGSAAFAALKAKYSSTPIPPAPQPPAPIPAPPAALPKVTSFSSTNSWPTCILSWKTTGASAVIIDSNGVSRSVPANGSVTLTTLGDRKDAWSYKNDWQIKAADEDGNLSAATHLVINAKF